MSPAAKALTAAWLKKKAQIFAGKLTRPDAEDPDTVNHLNWYGATGYTRSYRGEKTLSAEAQRWFPMAQMRLSNVIEKG